MHIPLICPYLYYIISVIILMTYQAHRTRFWCILPLHWALSLLCWCTAGACRWSHINWVSQNSVFCYLISCGTLKSIILHLRVVDYMMVCSWMCLLISFYVRLLCLFRYGEYQDSILGSPNYCFELLLWIIALNYIIVKLQIYVLWR